MSNVLNVRALILKRISLSDLTLKWAVLKLQKIQTFKADWFLYDDWRNSSAAGIQKMYQV